MPIREEGNQANFFFLPFFTLKDSGFLPELDLLEKRPVLGEPKWPLHFTDSPFIPTTRQGVGAAVHLRLSCLTARAHPEHGSSQQESEAQPAQR